MRSTVRTLHSVGLHWLIIVVFKSFRSSVLLLEDVHLVFVLSSMQNVEGELQKAPSRDSSDCSKEQDGGKRHKTDQNVSSNLRNKQAGKQVKDDSDGGEPPKDNYVHVRAKRGQATNSHSLAERVTHSLLLAFKDNVVINLSGLSFLDILNES